MPVWPAVTLAYDSAHLATSKASDDVVPHRRRSHESAQLPPYVLSTLKSTDFEAEYATCMAAAERPDMSAECPSKCTASKQTHIDAV